MDNYVDFLTIDGFLSKVFAKNDWYSNDYLKVLIKNLVLKSNDIIFGQWLILFDPRHFLPTLINLSGSVGSSITNYVRDMSKETGLIPAVTIKKLN